jgi:hypothetical protein
VQLLSFEDMEKILDFKLPSSAYKDRAWWSNPTSPTNHPYAQSWLEAGWRVDSVDQLENLVNFRRTTSNSVKNVGQPTKSTKHYSYKPPKAAIGQNVGTSKPIDAYQFLLNLGFEEVGEWFLEGNSVRFRLTKNEGERNILYAFVAQENVKYIGKSTMTLYRRMNGYRNPGPTQTTNIKNNARISEHLQEGKSVQIFTLLQKEVILYKGFSVNIAAGLEDNLLVYIRPPWNYRI